MGIDKIAKALKSCNKKMGKNLTISVVVGFLLSCAVVMGTETGTKIETKTKAKIKIEGKNNNYNLKKNLKSISDFSELDDIFKNGDLSKTTTIAIEGKPKELNITIKYDDTSKKITINYNGTQAQEIDLTLLDEKAYNLLLKGLTSFDSIDEDNILTNTQIIDKFGINNGAIFVNRNGQEIKEGAIGINNGNIFAYSRGGSGQYIDNGIGINNGNIFTDISDYGQRISNGLGVNNGNIRTYFSGQYISDSLGINNGNIFTEVNDPSYYSQNINNGLGINNGNIYSNSSGQNIHIEFNNKALGINNGNIFAGYIGQDIFGLGINNGNIFAYYGQYISGLGINSGVIYSDTSSGSSGQKIYNSSGIAINNGIIIANTAYGGNGTFYKNGIALKRDDNNNLILNNENDYNNEVNILDKNELYDSQSGENIKFSGLSLNKYNVGENNAGDKIQGYNLFINNLGNDNSDDKNNQLILDKNLDDDYSNTHITTAVTENGKLTEGKAVVKVDNGSNEFSMDKSTIVGYFETNGTLVDMTSSKTVNLDNSVISAFAGDKHSGFDDENNSVNVTAVKFGAGTNVTLNNSTVMGKMEFDGDTTNTLNLNSQYHGMSADKSKEYKDGTQFMTSVDNVVFNGNSDDTINITTGTENIIQNDVNKSGKGFVSIGDVDFGAGNDTLTLDFDDYINGNIIINGTIDFGSKQNEQDNKEDKIKFSNAFNMENWNSAYATGSNDKNTNIVKNLTFLNLLLENTENLDTLQLADGGNYFVFDTVNDKGETVSLDFTGTVKGGTGADTFVINSDESLKKANIDGGAESDTLSLGFVVDENMNFSNIKNVEKLYLSGAGQNIVNLTGADFSQVTNGKTDDIFTIDNFDIDIENGSKIILSKAIDNNSEETKNYLGNIKYIRNLQLANEENTLNINNLNGYFSNISGGSEKDTFISSINNLKNLILNGGSGDILELTNGITANTDLSTLVDNSKILGITNLQLAKGENNTIEIDNSQNNLSAKYEQIIGGNSGNTFEINNVDNYKKVTGGEGIDKINIKENFDNTTNDYISGIFEDSRKIENLELSGKENIVDLKTNFTDKTLSLNGSENTVNINTSKIGTINFGTRVNNVFIEKEINAENLKFADGENNVIIENEGDISGTLKFGAGEKDTLTLNHDNGIFDFNIEEAETVILGGKNDTWRFAENSSIVGDTIFNLNGKTLNFMENEKDNKTDEETSVSNTGNLGISSGNNLVFTNVDYIKDRITLSKGTIKVGFNDSIKIEAGKEFVLSSGGKINLGNDLKVDTYSFLNTSNGGTIVDGKITFTVKNWEDYQGYSDVLSAYTNRYNEKLKDYNSDNSVTNAFNTFDDEAIINFIIADAKLNYFSNEDLENGEVKYYKVLKTDKLESGKESILIATMENPITQDDKNMEIGFKNVSVDGKIEIKLTDGDKNIIHFGNADNTAVNISGEGIDATTSTKEVTINIAGGNINNISKIVMNDENSTINLTGNNISIENLNLGKGENKVNITDSSQIKELVIKKVEGAKNTINITSTNNSDKGFNNVLSGANGSVDFINVANTSELKIFNNYSGQLNFDGANNKITFDEKYSGEVNFTDINNEITINSEINGGNFSFSTGNNTISVGENGKITETLTFSKETGDTFRVNNSKGNFDYRVANADEIILSGGNNQEGIQWNFSESNVISGTDVKVTVEDNGVINFTVGKDSSNNLTGINPFSSKGTYTINGNIKLTFNETLIFDTVSDLENTILKSTANNISLGKDFGVSVPNFMAWDNDKKGFIIKSAEDMYIEEVARGNYEYLLTEYYNRGNQTVTEIFNTNSAEDIKRKVENSIFKELHLYSFNGTKDNLLSLEKVYVKTNEKNENTNAIFNNFSAGNEFIIEVKGGTDNIVSLLGDVALEKGIDGRNSEGNITLNLGGGKEIDLTANKENMGVVLGKKDDTLNLHSSINGTLDGYKGDNKLNIGEEVKSLDDNNNNDDNNSENNTSKVITLSGTIKNFKDINLNQDTKLNSDLKIISKLGANDKDTANGIFTEKTTINLKGNNLTLGINYKDTKGTFNGKDVVIGHALYDKGISVDNNTGKVIIDINEDSINSYISMGENNQSSFENTENFETNSTNFEVKYDEENNLIEVKSTEYFLGKDDSIKYGHLQKIYESLKSAGEEKVLIMNPSASTSDKTKDEAIKAQLEYYGKIYHSSPYAYSNEVSKKSAELITNSLLENKVMPDLNKWTFGGSIAGREADSDNNFYGANYYGVDDTKAEVDINSRLYGAYAFGEYGVSENKSIGFAIAGTNGTTDISGGSKLESNAVFISAYAKQNMGNLNLMVGLGYQHSFYDSTRVASNNFQSTTVDKKYEDDLFTIFAGARYIYNLGNGFSLEPNAKLNISHVMQNDIDENDSYKDVTIEVDSQDFTSIDTEIGVDIVKQINTEKGKLSFKAGVSLVYALDGYEDEFLNARVVGATEDFEIISPESDRARVKFNLGTEYELENGMFYNLHGNYITSSHDTDYSVSFGAGYKF